MIKTKVRFSRTHNPRPAGYIGRHHEYTFRVIVETHLESSEFESYVALHTVYSGHEESKACKIVYDLEGTGPEKVAFIITKDGDLETSGSIYNDYFDGARVHYIANQKVFEIKVQRVDGKPDENVAFRPSEDPDRIENETTTILEDMFGRGVAVRTGSGSFFFIDKNVVFNVTLTQVG